MTDAFVSLPVRGPVPALHFDGSRTWLVADGAAWAHDASGLRRAVDLGVLGEAASKTRLLTTDGDDVIVTCPTDPRGHQGWGVHRIDSSGRLRARFEVLAPPATFAELDPTLRVGDAIRTLRRSTLEEVGLGLDLTTALPPLRIPRLLQGLVAAGTVAGSERWVACLPTDEPPFDLKLEVRDDRRVAYAVGIGRTPANHVAVGDGWVAWSVGSRLTIRREDGTTLSPRVGGWVRALSSAGPRVAALVDHADGPRVVVWTP